MLLIDSLVKIYFNQKNEIYLSNLIKQRNLNLNKNKFLFKNLKKFLKKLYIYLY
jgi:hypothetical protein